MDKYVVYVHTNLINNKKYVGITKQNPPELRWGKDGSGYGTNSYFASAIKHYGWNNFSHEILYDNLTKEEACEKKLH